MDLFPHQERILGTLSKHDSFALFWSMRVMKTLPMVLHISNLIMQGKAKDDYLLCEQINGRASVGLVSMAYHLIASIGCELSIDGSRLESMWITLKNGAQIRLH